MNRNDRAITGFTMLGHATFHAYELSIPIFIVAWLHAFDVTPAVLGLVTGVSYALIGVGSLPSGMLSDVYGSRRLVVASMLGMGLSFVVVSLAPNVLVLALALVGWGAAASMYHPTGLSLLSRGAHSRGTALGYHGAAGNVGTALGPLAAAVLLSFFQWRVVAAIFVVPALVTGVAALRFEFDETAALDAASDGTDTADGATDGGDDTADGATDGGDDTETAGGAARIGSLREFLADSRLLFTGAFVLVFALEVVDGLYYRGSLTFLPEILGSLPAFAPVSAFGASFPPSQYAYAAILFVGVAGQFIGGHLTDRVDPAVLLAGCFAVLVVVSLLFDPAQNAGVLPLLAVCAVLGFFLYGAVPVLQATVARYTTSDAYGLSFGYVYLAMFGVGALGSVLAGSLLTYTSVGTLFAVLAGLAGLCVLLSLRLLATSHATAQ